MALTIKLDRNWSSFQLANSAPPLSVTDSAIAPSARIQWHRVHQAPEFKNIGLGALLASSVLRAGLGVPQELTAEHTPVHFLRGPNPPWPRALPKMKTVSILNGERQTLIWRAFVALGFNVLSMCSR